MAAISDIPREVLILVYVLCPDIRTAVRLSLSCREYREVWLENCKHIAKTILESEIPAYEDAAELAIAESRYRNQDTINACASASNAPDRGDPGVAQAPVHLWLPCLLRNAGLATAVYTEIEAWLMARPPDDPRWKVQFTPWPMSYYFVRQLALSYHLPTLRPALISALETCSPDTLQTHQQMSSFMVEWLSSEEQLRHGIPKADEERTLDDELKDNFSQPDWEQAHDVMFEAWERRGCRALLRGPHRGEEEN
ncbi:hypothetical protein M409DRAFT_55374 [Zasmidium cellare ATCC 36951]|uniref:Uncharacterized protein n=1 Tax=Zasmidium cellare ATCC 36951 TaxID=1080233 RepID=A0A6A6CFP0_ZASCE|nr:uncharacterized protein M409DRAFT_55374 [Zasmidium cellare ATCC 36951]KAF2166024.1 hypothetical protein M409DRAFT_55374 [Zasmidium cellare ATCC 36951]